MLHIRSVLAPPNNPPNRFELAHIEWEGEPPPADLEVHEEHTKSALAKNNSPDIGFRWSLNPYRGCFHACAYCYARPSHQYLGYGAGTDFDRHIVVKTNIAQRLRETLRKPRWTREVIAFSGNTDCYQPLEAHYQLTRACLETCAEFETPVVIITKGKLVRRDVDVLQTLVRNASCQVTVSIGFSSDADAKRVEPFASPPAKRFETLEMLARAGIPTCVAVAPVILGLNDMQIPEILQRAKDAGAQSAFMILLRLPQEVASIFDERMRDAFPLKHKKIMNAVRDARGGRLNESRFGARMHGQGARWNAVSQLFEHQCRALGLAHQHPDPPEPPPPKASRRQLPLAF